MARWIGPENEDHATAVLAAAYAWRERCFLADGSLFGDESLWTVENIRELRRRVIDNPIEGDADFIDKFEKQLKTASVQVKQLAAETLWFLYLFPHRRGMKPKTKRDRIERVWESSGSSLPNDDYLDDRALRGVARLGLGYIARLDLELGFLLQMAARWKNTPKPRREELIDDGAPWNFVKWLDEAGSSARQMRNIVLYLLFPDHMERIAPLSHKKKIVETFGNRGVSGSGSEKEVSDAEIDRDLYKIRADLERKYGTKELDFYHPPLKGQWTPPGKSVGVQSVSSENATQEEDGIPLNTILYGPPGTGKTYATALRCVAICDGHADDLSDEDIRDRYAALVEEKRIEFITFHQSYGYEEFVEGLRPRTSDGAAGFQLAPTDGVLKRIAERARKARQLPHVLVIDEINRANVSKVMGELVTLLEEDKREGASNEIGVTLPHSHERFTLPPNLHILGTMNTADRSIALLDTALRRRFRFEEMAPDPGKLKKDVDGIDLRAVLRTINERLEWLLDRDHLIGHAWLMGARDKAQVDGIIRNKIIPLIAEYFYDDWSKVRAVLGGGDDFVQGEELKPPPGLGDDSGEDRYRWTIRDSFDDGAYARLISGSGPAETAENARRDRQE